LEWYEVSQIKDRVSTIEQYFVGLAANEDDLHAYGFRLALSLPGAVEAFAALRTFNEDFSSLRRAMLREEKTLAQELEQLDTQGKLSEQVALISLRLRMAQARRPVSMTVFSALRRGVRLPAAGKGLFGEAPVSLHNAIINLERLRGVTGHFSDYLQNRQLADNEVFKPSNVQPDRVVEFIDAALSQIESATTLAPEELQRLQNYLLEARKEALSSKPSWSKIVGALVIVAAVTSGLADAPGAAKTVKDAIEYILGTSISKPLQKYLPSAPERPNPEPPRNVA